MSGDDALTPDIGYMACTHTWPAHSKCDAWGSPYAVHGCSLRPSHRGVHVCLCGQSYGKGRR